MAEWLSRKPRKLVPSGAQVRVLPASFFAAREAAGDGFLGPERDGGDEMARGGM